MEINIGLALKNVSDWKRDMPKQPKPWSIYTLMILLLLLGLGGIGGGIALLADPSGAMMGLPADLLDGVFVTDFFWPGIFLIVVMGFGPYLVYYGVWQGYIWGRAAVLVQGFTLVGWILFQVVLLGPPMFIQTLYLLWGVALIAGAVLPKSRSYFSQN